MVSLNSLPTAARAQRHPESALAPYSPRSANAATSNDLAFVESHYHQVARNCSPEQIALIEADGPLNVTEFIRWRQEIYRRMVSLKHGVTYNADGSINHPA